MTGVRKARRTGRRAMSDDDSQNERWHVNRSIPVAFIISITVLTFGQIGTGAWFIAREDSRIDALEKVQATMAPQTERLARVEEKIGNLATGIADIKVILAGQDGRRR